MRYVFADADRPSYRTEQRRREKDLAFLERVRAASLEELAQMRREHAGKSAPQWKVIAIERAIARTRKDRYRP